MLTLLRFVGVGVEAVHVAAAGVKFAAAGVGVVAVHVFGAAVSVIASSTGVKALSSAPACCLSSLEKEVGTVGADSCVFLQFPRRSGWQFEQALFTFLQEQFLHRPLALHRQQGGAICKSLEQKLY